MGDQGPGRRRREGAVGPDDATTMPSVELPIGQRRPAPVRCREVAGPARHGCGFAARGQAGPRCSARRPGRHVRRRPGGAPSWQRGCAWSRSPAVASRRLRRSPGPGTREGSPRIARTRARRPGPSARRCRASSAGRGGRPRAALCPTRRRAGRHRGWPTLRVPMCIPANAATGPLPRCDPLADGAQGRTALQTAGRLITERNLRNGHRRCRPARLAAGRTGPRSYSIRGPLAMVLDAQRQAGTDGSRRTGSTRSRRPRSG